MQLNSTPGPAPAASPVPTELPDEERRHTDWRQVTFGLALSCFVAFQQFKLPPLLPNLLAEFHYSRPMAAGFMSVYALVGVLASVPMGGWLRRYGYRKGLLGGVLATGLGLLLALALARFAGAMLLARGLEGITYAAFAIAGPAIATQAARIRDLPIVTGLLSGWIPIGQIAAGLLALAVPDWQTIWLLALGLTILLAIPSWRHRDHDHRPQPAVTSPPASGKDGSPAASRGLQSANLLSAIVFLLWSTQYFAFMTWLTQFLIERHHLDPRNAVVVYLIPVVVLLCFSLMTGWALGRGLPLVRSLLVCLILQALVWAAMPVLDGTPGLIALVVYGICAGITPTCLFHLPHVIAARRDKTRGRAGPEAFATLMTGRNIGVFLGPILLAGMMSLTGSWNLAAYVIAALTVMSAVVTWRLGHSLR